MNNEKMREEFEAWWSATMNAMEMDLHRFVDGYSCHDTNRGWMAWQASRAATGGYCIVPSETIKKAYALASSVCGDCYAGEDTEILLANQLTKEISKSDYWMNMK